MSSKSSSQTPWTVKLTAKKSSNFQQKSPYSHQKLTFEQGYISHISLSLSKNWVQIWSVSLCDTWTADECMWKCIAPLGDIYSGKVRAKKMGSAAISEAKRVRTQDFLAAGLLGAEVMIPRDAIVVELGANDNDRPWRQISIVSWWSNSCIQVFYF